MGFVKFVGQIHGAAVTAILWIYYTLGFLIFFAPFYFWAYLAAKDPESAFQRLNCRFYRILFAMIRLLIPGHQWRIASAVRNLRGAVIVCNHVSYLDPILLISLYKKHKTIVKGRLFHIPVFGRMLALAGYIPSETGGRFGDLMIRQIEAMGTFLAAGGNLFIFPEGTRSRNGKMGTLNPGAFKIARRSRTPIQVLVIRNTERMFTPGRLFFQTAGPNTITVDLAGTVETEKNGRLVPVTELMESVEVMLKTHP